MSTFRQNCWRWLPVYITAIFMALIALSSLEGLLLPFDYQVDPNYSHVLYGIHLAHGGAYVNSFYPGLTNLPLYAVAIKLADGYIGMPTDLLYVERMTYVCRLAQLTVNEIAFVCLCIPVWRLTKGISHAGRLTLLTAFAFLIALQFSLIYYSFLLRPDNGILVGLGIALLGLTLSWQHLRPMYRPMLASVLIGAGCYITIIAKNQTLPFIVLICGMHGLLLYRRGSLAIALTQLMYVTASYAISAVATISLVYWCFPGTEAFAEFFDPTWTIRNTTSPISFDASKLLRATAWILTTCAPAICCILLSIQLAWQRAIPWRLYSVLVLPFLACVTVVFFLRLYASYNLLIPVICVHIVAVTAAVLMWEDFQRCARVAIPCLIATLPISVQANAELRRRIIDDHWLIASAYGSLYPVIYPAETDDFVDHPAMSLSLGTMSPDRETHSSYYMNVFRDLYPSDMTGITSDPRYRMYQSGRYRIVNLGRSHLRSGWKRVAFIGGLKRETPTMPEDLQQPTIFLTAERAGHRIYNEHAIPVDSLDLDITFTFGQLDGIQTLISDWTTENAGKSMYVAFRSGTFLRIGDGVDFHDPLLSLHPEKEHQLEYRFRAGSTWIAIDGKVVYFAEQTRTFDLQYPLVIGNQGECPGETFQGSISSCGLRIPNADISQLNLAHIPESTSPETTR